MGHDPTTSGLRDRYSASWVIQTYSRPDGYCPHMISIKSRVYCLSTTDPNTYSVFDAFVSVFVSLYFSYHFPYQITSTSTGGGIWTLTMYRIWADPLFQLEYTCVAIPGLEPGLPFSWRMCLLPVGLNGHSRHAGTRIPTITASLMQPLFHLGYVPI